MPSYFFDGLGVPRSEVRLPADPDDHPREGVQHAAGGHQAGARRRQDPRRLVQTRQKRSARCLHTAAHQFYTQKLQQQGKDTDNEIAPTKIMRTATPGANCCCITACIQARLLPHCQSLTFPVHFSFRPRVWRIIIQWKF